MNSEEIQIYRLLYRVLECADNLITKEGETNVRKITFENRTI